MLTPATQGFTLVLTAAQVAELCKACKLPVNENQPCRQRGCGVVRGAAGRLHEHKHILLRPAAFILPTNSSLLFVAALQTAALLDSCVGEEILGCAATLSRSLAPLLSCPSLCVCVSLSSMSIYKVMWIFRKSFFLNLWEFHERPSEVVAVELIAGCEASLL